MSTRIGFFMFVGLVVGAVIGAWLPYIPVLEAIAGAVIAVIIGLLLDRRAGREAENDHAEPPASGA